MTSSRTENVHKRIAEGGSALRGVEKTHRDGGLVNFDLSEQKLRSETRLCACVVARFSRVQKIPRFLGLVRHCLIANVKILVCSFCSLARQTPLMND